jgi:NAD+ diphosphatase
MPHQLGFVVNDLDRAGVERDHDALARHAEDPRALTILIAGDNAVLRTKPDGLSALLPTTAVNGAGPVRDRVFLGLLADVPVIGTQLEAAAAEHFRDESRFRVTDVRSIAVQGLVPAGELGILAQAKALLYWHGQHPFCAKCGAPTVVASAGLRRDCTACGGQHFPRTDPVTIMLISRGEKCILGRQTRFIPGMYSCLAGFVSPGETIEDAVRREVLEEAGIRVGRVRYEASQPWPFPASLMIGCRGEALDDEITLDRDELEDGRWFSRQEVRQMLDKTHPDGLKAPVEMAIANLLLRRFVEQPHLG